MPRVTVRALKRFYDVETGDERSPGDEWETTVTHAARLIEQGVVQGVDGTKRAAGPGADKRDRGPDADK